MVQLIPQAGPYTQADLLAGFGVQQEGVETGFAECLEHVPVGAARQLQQVQENLLPPDLIHQGLEVIRKRF
jgi:hypothetical protein